MLTALTLVLALFVAAPAADDANALAVKLTTEGAAHFDKKDSKALAETYTEDASLTLVIKDKNDGEKKTESKRGRGEIQATYDSIFRTTEPIHSKNTVEHARLINDDTLLITGTFDTGIGQTPIKVAFVQIRVRQNDKWLISNIQLFLLESK